jgi:hypothetical protein
VKKVIERESIKRPGDDDSSSSSSSSEEAKPVSRKVTAKLAETVAPRTTHKASNATTKKAGELLLISAKDSQEYLDVYDLHSGNRRGIFSKNLLKHSVLNQN